MLQVLPPRRKYNLILINGQFKNLSGRFSSNSYKNKKYIYKSLVLSMINNQEKMFWLENGSILQLELLKIQIVEVQHKSQRILLSIHILSTIKGLTWVGEIQSCYFNRSERLECLVAKFLFHQCHQCQ